MKLIRFFTFSFLTILFLSPLQGAPERCTLFEPYEWLFDSAREGIIPNYVQKRVAWSFRIEEGHHIHGHPSKEQTCLNWEKKDFSPLMYLHTGENAYAAFLGHAPDTLYGSFTQQYTPFAGATSNGITLPLGHLTYGNLVSSLEVWVSENLRLGWYLPYYWITLSNVQWLIGDKPYYFEQTLNNDFINIIQKTNNLNLSGFSHRGLGDSSLLLSWQDSFMEKRDFLTGITCALRAGLHLPTRTAASDNKAENSLLRICLGYDCKWGAMCGGSLALDIGSYWTCGVSADFTKFFGENRMRRIKTDSAQTDLLLLSQEWCFIDPGFKQQFLLYTDIHTFLRDITLTAAYSYTKQNESEIILSSDLYPQAIAASMERLESWTHHNIIGQIQGYRSWNDTDLILGLFIKKGFKGHRSLPGLTTGLSFSCTF